MTPEVLCPHCGKPLPVAADPLLAGQSQLCPNCGAMIAAPGDMAEPPTPSVAADSGAGQAPALFRQIKPHSEDLIDMTSMVDIVFFLLIFFLVTSMQALESVIGLPTPQTKSSQTPVQVADYANDPNYVTVTIYEDDTVWVEDQQVYGEQDLRVKLRAAKRENEGMTGMMVIGAPDASHGTFVMVLDAGADAGLTDLKFSVPDEVDFPGRAG